MIGSSRILLDYPDLTRPRCRRGKSLWREPASVAVAVLLLLSATPTGRADTRVVFSPLVDGPEFAEATEFFNGYLTPKQYDTERSLAGTGGSWKLGKTLDLYLREFVLLGKGDVNGDGKDEYFYILNDPGWCGSKGCRMLIVEKLENARNLICETEGSDHHVWIKDRRTVRGYHEMEAAFPIYWIAEECYPDDPDIRDLMPPLGPPAN